MTTHDHQHSQHSNQRILLLPFVLTLGFAIVEAIGGWFTGSLALLGDAGHMVSDAAALGLAWFGAWVAARPVTQRHSYGLVRAEVIVAMMNGLFMLLVVAVIVYEAIQRLQVPQAVKGAEVMLVAALGLVVNIVVARQLRHHHENINQRAAFLHVLGDLLGSFAALLAGAIIYFTGWMPIDPILSLFISVLILISTVRLLREALHVLMEGVPLHLDIDEIEAALANIPKVSSVYHVHVWSISSETVALSANVVLQDMQDWHEVLVNVRLMLHERFDIDHVTIQPETSQPGTLEFAHDQF